VVVSCWNHLHFPERPELEVSVIRVQREGAADTKGDPHESWFVWVGEPDIALQQVARWYKRGFSQEHGYRFLMSPLFRPSYPVI
jgi:hypothetical protein